MHRSIIYILTIGLCFLLHSCVSETWERETEVQEPTEEQEANAVGKLDLTLSSGAATRVTSTLSAEEAGKFLVTLYKGSDIYRATTQLKDLDKNLPAGYGYSLVAENCTESDAETVNDGWGQKRFAGQSSQFAIKAGETTKVNVSCSVVNAGLSINFDESVTASYDSYTFTVTDGSRTIEFNSATAGKVAYFNVPADGKKTINYRVVAGTDVDKSGTIDLGKAVLKNFNITLPNSGTIGIEITYDDTMDVVVEEIIIDEQL
ncbi:MAG: DUF4493 domain-containing protein [Bacteroidaceae bacterium]|nr:DUF4493 domain-containing protein [Bacteroidaceae bacterium]